MKIVFRTAARFKPEVLVRAWREFGNTLEGQYGRLALAVVASISATALELLRPWPIQFVVDHILPATKRHPHHHPHGIAQVIAELDPTTILISSCVLVILIGGGVGQFALLSLVWSAEVGRKITSRLRRRVFEHIHRLPMSFHFSQRTGDLLMRMTGDISMVRDILVNTWLSLIGPGLICAGTVVIMLWVEWRLALLALLPLPFVLIRVRRSSKRLTNLVRESRKMEGQAASIASESLRQIRTVKSYGAEEKMAKSFVRDARSADRAGVQATRLAATQSRASQMLAGIGLAGMLWIGTRRVLGGNLTTGELLVMISYSRSLYKPMRKMSDEGTKLGKVVACTERLLDILARPAEPRGQGEVVEHLDGDLVFENVSFSYDGERRALRRLDFVVPRGTLAVLSGANGSGKSTTLNILLRLSLPSEGRVTIGGRSIADFELESYRRAIAYVPQDIQLFAGTIKENILFGRPDASDDDVVEAAQSALAHDFIMRLPQGYETDIGEAGAALSGGEARRIMLARAAVRRTSIVILDEPLAALDPNARAVVAKALRSIGENRTTIVIHHGSTEDIAPDMEVCLRHGEVAEIKTAERSLRG